MPADLVAVATMFRHREDTGHCHGPHHIEQRRRLQSVQHFILVSITKVTESGLAEAGVQFGQLLAGDLEVPFHLFGISASDILGLFKNNPENAHAFLQTFMQIGRAYDYLRFGRK